MLPNPPSQGKSGDALVLNGEPLAISAVITVAHGRRVSIAPACLERLKQARAAMLLTLENGKPVYGITTGVGALRGIKVDPAEAAHFNRLLILSHRVSHGDAVSHAVVRATMLCRAQGLSMGRAGVRPAVIEALIDALNADEIPTIHAIGSVGQADLASLAEVAEALIARWLALQTREALALIGANSFSLGWAALALDRAERSNLALEAAAALTMEALLCNPDAIDPAVYQVHPSTGLKQSVLRLRELLAGGALLTGEQPPRLLQDPLSLRVAPQVHGTAREDRVSMAPLAARRLDEQTQLAMRLAAVELACAAQAIDLRKRSAALGTGTGILYRLVRSHIPALAAGDAPVADLTELTAALERLPA